MRLCGVDVSKKFLLLLGYLGPFLSETFCCLKFPKFPKFPYLFVRCVLKYGGVLS